LLLARDPRSPQDPRHRQRDPRARRPEGPPQAHRLIRRPTGDLRPHAYRGRNVIERAFNGFKHWRGLATRYDKHAIVYRGGLVLAAVLLWLTDLGDTYRRLVGAGQRLLKTPTTRPRISVPDGGSKGSRAALAGSRTMPEPRWRMVLTVASASPYSLGMSAATISPECAVGCWRMMT
ncbi:MAG: transposase, partial [Actinobacteria bacterium]|nr:transposase [Actinomycetota bacterium]